MKTYNETTVEEILGAYTPEHVLSDLNAYNAEGNTTPTENVNDSDFLDWQHQNLVAILQADGYVHEDQA